MLFAPLEPTSPAVLYTWLLIFGVPVHVCLLGAALPDTQPEMSPRFPALVCQLLRLLFRACVRRDGCCSLMCVPLGLSPWRRQNAGRRLVWSPAGSSERRRPGLEWVRTSSPVGLAGPMLSARKPGGQEEGLGHRAKLAGRQGALGSRRGAHGSVPGRRGVAVDRAGLAAPCVSWRRILCVFPACPAARAVWSGNGPFLSEPTQSELSAVSEGTFREKTSN